jgi:hypothetical protein
MMYTKIYTHLRCFGSPFTLKFDRARIRARSNVRNFHAVIYVNLRKQVYNLRNLRKQVYNFHAVIYVNYVNRSIIYVNFVFIYAISVLSAFRPRGVPGPTTKLSLRVPAQMGRRETGHKGGEQ